MLTLRKGDLREETGIIMHGVNCNPSINDSGVAAILWAQYPQALKGAQQYAKVHHMHGLGSFCAVRGVNKGKSVQIINAYTQYYGGPNFMLPAWEQIVKDLNLKYAGQTIKMPRIGAGIGGGNWAEIEDVLLTHGKSVNWEVVCL